MTYKDQIKELHEAEKHRDALVSAVGALKSMGAIDGDAAFKMEDVESAVDEWLSGLFHAIPPKPPNPTSKEDSQ